MSSSFRPDTGRRLPGDCMFDARTFSLGPTALSAKRLDLHRRLYQDHQASSQLMGGSVPPAFSPTSLLQTSITLLHSHLPLCPRGGPFGSFKNQGAPKWTPMYSDPKPRGSQSPELSEIWSPRPWSLTAGALQGTPI